MKGEQQISKREQKDRKKGAFFNHSQGLLIEFWAIFFVLLEPRVSMDAELWNVLTLGQ